jgi:ATP-dependent exoDNAse (exonuclease V) alpha subunit
VSVHRITVALRLGPHSIAVTARPNLTPPSAYHPRRELRGVVERITFQNSENGFTVARLAPERPEAEAEAARGEDRLVTVVGTLADLTPGEAIVAHGRWRNDAKHGWQFQAVDYRTALPASLQGMKKYLGSGLVKGVGPVNASRIVDTFGEQTFAVIDNHPMRLTEVPGIGPIRAGRIAAAGATSISQPWPPRLDRQALRERSSRRVSRARGQWRPSNGSPLPYGSCETEPALTLAALEH